MDFWRILIVLAIVFSLFSAWKDYRKKVDKAEVEEEKRQAGVSFLLKIFLLILVIAVFIF
ncbi:hypothetical protein E2636_18805 (plasmid) [Paenisporosarcina antarctica]|uniref:Uncharacterized protein n=1 Tax=Paenisporosarcina antarctica TaxID=417367 RepID=A0A4P7A352_9BACL|nr:hypothetical protein E2636_18805 [Paenisporosarcina antarctica]